MKSVIVHLFKEIAEKYERYFIYSILLRYFCIYVFFFDFSNF